MSESDHDELSFEAFEVFEAQQLADQNMRQVEGMVKAVVASNLPFASHDFVLLHGDYYHEDDTVSNPLEARRVANMATDLFYNLFEETQRSARDVTPDEQTGTAYSTIWIGQVDGIAVRFVEQAWQPEQEDELGVSMSAYVELPRPKETTRDVVPAEPTPRVGRLGRFITRLFGKQ